MKRTFEEGWRSDGRKPILWIEQCGKLHLFSGKSIPGVVQVCATWPIKKSSLREATAYSLKLAPGAVPCELLAFATKRLWPESSIGEALARFKKQYGLAKISERMFVAALKRDFRLAYARMAHGEEVPGKKDWERSDSVA